MNLNTTQEHSRWFKKTGCFQKKRNNNNIKGVKCYNCDIKEHYMWECCKLKKSQIIITIKQESEDIK